MKYLSAAFAPRPASAVLSDLSELAGEDCAAADVYGAGEWLQERFIHSTGRMPCMSAVPRAVRSALISANPSNCLAQAFETEVAAALGKPCGRFMLTGVCAQMAALAVYADLPARRSAVEPRQSFVCHATSHLLLWELDSARELLGLVPLIAGTDRPMTAADVEHVLRRQSSVGIRPSAIIVTLALLLPRPIPAPRALPPPRP